MLSPDNNRYEETTPNRRSAPSLPRSRLLAGRNSVFHRLTNKQPQHTINPIALSKYPAAHEVRAMNQLCLSSRSMLGFVFVLVFVAGSVSASQAGETILHPRKPLLDRPILVEADIVRIQVGKDLPAQF